MNEEEMVERVKEYLRVKPEYIEYLSRAIKAEEEYVKSNGEDWWGWRPSEVGIPPYVIARFLELGLVKKVFSSRRYRIYRLAIDLELARRILGELEEELNSRGGLSYAEMMLYVKAVAFHPQLYLRLLEYIEDEVEKGNIGLAHRLFEKVALRIDKAVVLLSKASNCRSTLVKEKIKQIQRVVYKALEVARKLDKALEEVSKLKPSSIAKKIGYT